VGTNCYLLQSSDRSHLAILFFADMATQNAHRRFTAAATNSVAIIALVFINDSLTRLGKLYCHDESDVFRRGYD
jgi:hypothetical protein